MSVCAPCARARVRMRTRTCTRTLCERERRATLGPQTRPKSSRTRIDTTQIHGHPQKQPDHNAPRHEPHGRNLPENGPKTIWQTCACPTMHKSYDGVYSKAFRYSGCGTLLRYSLLSHQYSTKTRVQQKRTTANASSNRQHKEPPPTNYRSPSTQEITKIWLDSLFLIPTGQARVQIS